VLMTHLCHNPVGRGAEIPQCSRLPHPTRTFGGRAKPIPSPSLKVRTVRLGCAILPQ
jgi:hypothetical protein